MTDDSALFTRAAVLAWASAILGTEYSSFAQVPAHELALLLYCIAQRRTEDGPGARSPPLSLQEIQFHLPADGGTAAEVARLRNTEHMLALVRRLARETAAATATSAGATPAASPGVPPVTQPPLPTLSLSESLTAEAWAGGRAFVEELKVWRWVRALAHAGGQRVDELRQARAAFLRGEVSAGREAGSASVEEEPTAATLPVPAPPSHPSAPAAATPRASAVKRRRSPSPAGSPPLTGASGIASDEGVVAGDALSDGADVLWRCRAALERALAVPCASAAASRTPADAPTDRAVGCTCCPPVLALALQGNVRRVGRLEEVRRRAIAACLRKDMAELLRALGEVS